MKIHQAIRKHQYASRKHPLAALGNAEVPFGVVSDRVGEYRLKYIFDLAEYPALAGKEYSAAEQRGSLSLLRFDIEVLICILMIRSKKYA
jgi:hypothetical protein